MTFIGATKNKAHLNWPNKDRISILIYNLIKLASAWQNKAHLNWPIKDRISILIYNLIKQRQ